MAKFSTRKEMAELLKISERTFDRWMKEKRFKEAIIKNGKRWKRYDSEKIIATLQLV